MFLCLYFGAISKRVVDKIFIRMPFYVHRERRFPNVSLERSIFICCSLSGVVCTVAMAIAKEGESAITSRLDRYSCLSHIFFA